MDAKMNFEKIINRLASRIAQLEVDKACAEDLLENAQQRIIEMETTSSDSEND